MEGEDKSNYCINYMPTHIAYIYEYESVLK